MKVNKFYNDFNKDYNSNSRLYGQIIDILKEFGFQKIEMLEGKTDLVSKTLDMKYGCDMLLDNFGAGLRVNVISDRMENSYECFNIRKSRDTGYATEYQKRKEEIKNGLNKCKYMIQVYTNPEKTVVRELAIALTEDVFIMIDGNTKTWVAGGRSSWDKQAVFYKVPYKHVNLISIDLKIWKNKNYKNNVA